jgi:hypothetical protein
MFLSEIHFQASCHSSYLETRGLGQREKWLEELQAPPPSRQKKLKVEDTLLTSVVHVSSRNWRFTFPSDSLTTESCLLSSAKVKLLPWALRFPLVSVLEAVSAHSF